MHMSGNELIQTVSARVTLSLCGLFAMVVTAGGCGQVQAPEPGGFAATSRPIINGTPDTSQAHMAVVALTYGPTSLAFCTGTLVTPNVVVTAAHCLQSVQEQSLQIFFGNDVTQAGEYRGVSEILSHPDFVNGGESGDIGLIRLSANAPASVTPIGPLPASLGLTSADVGVNVDLVGFGVTELDTADEKLHVEIPIGYVCNQGSTCLEYIDPYCFEYAQSEGGTCSGDSGGPAFLFRGETEYLAGVTSYGDPDCTVYGVSTMVDAYESWINAFTGVPSEDCQNEVDDDSDDLVDCADPDCGMASVCQGANACEEAGTLTCGASINDTTVGGSSVFTSYSCLSQASEDGPERGYQLALPVGTRAIATLTPTGAGDLDLLLLSASDDGCSPNNCIDASVSSDSQPETLTFTLPAAGAYLVVETYNTPGEFTLEVTCTGQAEVCDSGADDDGDGDVDCADPDCDDDPLCAGDPEICDNGVDDNGDGQVDCEDPDCATATPCVTEPDLSEGGCGCRQSNPASSPLWPSLLLLLVFGLLRRRR
jgi:MYXO-CTERM domain-containing protein